MSTLISELPELGIYWLGHSDYYGNPELKNNFTPTKKKILIYIHGFQRYLAPCLHPSDPVYTKLEESEFFNYNKFDLLPASKEKVFYHNEWLDQGWNVGIFRYRPFSSQDFFNLERIEQNFHIPLTEYNYMSTTPEQLPEDSPLRQLTIVEAIVECYRRLLPFITSETEIRILGHSLGAQLAICCMGSLYQRFNHSLLPKRLELLDPFFTPSPKSWLLNKTPVQYCEPIVASLKSLNVAMTLYRTSPLAYLGFNCPFGRIGVGDPADALNKYVFWEGVRYNYLDVINPYTYFYNKHCLVTPWYLATLNMNVDEMNDSKVVGKAISSASTHDEIIECMNSNSYFIQKYEVCENLFGSRTESVEDDKFIRYPGTYQEYWFQ